MAVIATHLYLPHLSLVSLMMALLLSGVFLLLIYVIFSAPIPRAFRLSLSLALFVLLVLMLDVDRTNALFLLSTGPVVGFFLTHFYVEKYQTTFRENLMRSLLGICNSAAQYSPSLALAPTHFMHASVAPFIPRTILGSDKIGSLTRGVSYEYACEKATYSSVAFEGVVMTAHFPQPFKSSLLLNPVAADTDKHYHLIRTNDPAFDLVFRTYGNDPHAADALLDTKIKEELLKLHQDFPNQLMVALHGARLYLFFAFPLHFRTLPLFRPLSRCNGLLEYLCLSQRFESLIGTVLDGDCSQ